MVTVEPGALEVRILVVLSGSEAVVDEDVCAALLPEGAVVIEVVAMSLDEVAPAD